MIVEILMASASFAGTFIHEEKLHTTSAMAAEHSAKIEQMLPLITNELKRVSDEHFARHKKCGVGSLYGFKSDYRTKMNRAQQEDYIAKIVRAPGRPAECSNFGPTNLSETSCEIFTNRFLTYGMERTGQSDISSTIRQFRRDHGDTGHALLYALHSLGWKVLYWNPDVKVAHPSPAPREGGRPPMGIRASDHPYGYAIAKNRRTYYDVPVDGFLVNFRPSVSAPANNKALDIFRKKVPYFIGIAHAGFHVFSGTYGTVYESHTPREPHQVSNIERGIFDPGTSTGSPMALRDDPGYFYYSGIVAIPPGPWWNELKESLEAAP